MPIRLILMLALVALIANVLVLPQSAAHAQDDCIGDINDDNTVNATDLQLLSSAFRTTQPTYDLDGKAGINVIDILIAAANFGEFCGVPPTVDLSISAVEITQATQTTTNNVPLIAGRTTVVRIYAQSSMPTGTTNVTVSLNATRNGSPLAGSPLVIGPKTVPNAPSRATFASSFNATLPASWLTGNVNLTATVDATGTVPETNEANNTSALTAVFNSVPALDIKIVPIRYTHTPNGQVYPAPSIDSISADIRAMYPISTLNISWHTPVNFTGDLLNDANAWETLLNQVTSLKESEGAPGSQVYYGLIPTSNTNGRWFNGGIAGLGWIGFRASIGLDLPSPPFSSGSGELAAHEIGHNFGRTHAPCSVSGDPNYPYTGASIGHFGLDTAASRVWTPAAPDNAKDFMSYCSPQWVSDYTYKALYNDQRSNGLLGQAEGQPGLLLRATFDEAGGATIRPVYILAGLKPQLTATGDYTVELFDDSGALIVTHPVDVYEAEEPGLTVRAINTVLPAPSRPVATIRLLQAGTIVAQRDVQTPAAKARLTPAISRGGDGLTLTWGAIGQPVIIRYTTDNGQSWNTLGLDLTSGQLSISTQQLPAAPLTFEITPADTTAKTNVTINAAP